MKNFNLAAWALDHRPLVIYFALLLSVAGVFSYMQLGRMEDPDFTVRVMVITTVWPGASAREVEEQVTDKIERKLQDTPHLDYLKSLTTPGRSIIFVYLEEDTIAADRVRPTWLEIRNMVNDMKHTLPQGVVGPFYNDRFDDVFGCIYALTGKGYSPEEMRRRMESIRRTVLGVPGVRKADLVGVQPEKVHIEIESEKLAKLGIPPGLILNAIQTQNAMTPSGAIETSTDRVYLRVDGHFDDVERLTEMPIRAAGRTLRLGDLAKIQRTYADPPEPKVFCNGQEAIGLAISMEAGGNILRLGKNLDAAIARIQQDLPAGLELTSVANQPHVVKAAISEFIESFVAAGAIVLVVCFITLGLRSGIVVALCIPLVIAGTFSCMFMLGIDLHKISLGALIIALGLLVDDAIIVIEMMVVKLEQRMERKAAASFAYQATGIPILTGTLVTCAGFIPVGFSKGSASEFVGSIFSVVTIALLLSWLVAALATPLLGFYFVRPKSRAYKEGRDIYDSYFYRLFRWVLVKCLRHRFLVLTATVLSFLLALGLMKLVRQDFFGASTRPELIVELRLHQGASMKATEKIAREFARHFDGDENLANYTYYVGQGAPRFVLTIEMEMPDTNYAQFILVGKDLAARNALIKKTRELLANEMPEVQCNIQLIKTGPPTPYPVMFRLSGIDHDQVRQLAEQARDRMAENPILANVNLDWHEKNKVIHVALDQDKARVLNVDSQALALTLHTMLSGVEISEYREADRNLGVVLLLDQADRTDLSKVKELSIPVGNGRTVPLEQIATVSCDAEEGLIWRRDLRPTITVRADTVGEISGNDATLQVYNELKGFREALPEGYRFDIAGPLEQSYKAMGWLIGPVPAMIVIILTLLMLQLQDLPKVLMTLLTAPLGILGVAASLLLTDRPMGFVAQLGILALSGIIIRNSVILIQQIENQIAAGQSRWDAIVNSTIMRFRPIMLTAIAAILGMIPLVFSTFWGPMAIAIGGGIFTATVLTLIVLPVMYAAWYRVRPEK